MRVVGEAADGVQLLGTIAAVEWDLLMLDLSLPRLGSAPVLRQVLDRCPGARILVVTIALEAAHAAAIVRMGAAACLGKDRPPEEVLAAIRRISSV